jgi:hypothetical protein
MALFCFGLSLVSFYMGLLLGIHSGSSCPPCNDSSASKTANKEEAATSEHFFSIPPTVQKLVAGVGRVNRDAFFAKFDVGVPKDKSEKGNEQVLIMYNHEKSLPTKGVDRTLSVEDATEHCHSMKLVFTEPNQKHQCLAIAGQWESYHVYKYMRLPPGKDKKVEVDGKYDLRYVSRLHGDKGLQQQIPFPTNVKTYDETLVTYLSSLDKVLEELKPIAARAAKDNTIIVMVCNHGQSELLMNFACSCKARGLDLSQVLVFATDVETRELAEGLGLAAFYDSTNFAKMPEKAARFYADAAFSGMMMAKVYCVHMINLLGYNVLFQDVDIVWYRNPLEFFTNSSNPLYHFDMYFQDDGAHTRRYAPYSPNSGFYFVRHNERTEYFMHSLLMAGNIIAQSGSHQNAMASTLNEHASWRGLHVKTLDRDMDEFPGGYHFHQPGRKQYMKDLLAGNIKPYIFHMSWTANKDNKKLYFEQMGDWYVHDVCVGSTASKILANQQTNLATACCSAEPLIKCHYRDKPSKIPCKDSPPIDKGHVSWW